jgi:hypothetical protein
MITQHLLVTDVTVYFGFYWSTVQNYEWEKLFIFSFLRQATQCGILSSLNGC